MKEYIIVMRPTHTIDTIFGTRSRARVLGVLVNVSVPLNTAQIARLARISAPAANAALGELEAMGLVNSNRVGWATVHWIERTNVYVERIVLPAFAGQQGIADELERDLLETYDSLCVSIVLFGSYARGDQTAESDVDVVLVARSPSAAAALNDKTADDFTRFFSRWGAPLSPLVWDLEHAADIETQSPALYNELRRDGVVVKGLRPSEWSKHAEG